MPLPEPSAGENRTDFVSRCMGSDVMLVDFPNEEQRLAVCYAQWDSEENKEKFMDMLAEDRLSAVLEKGESVQIVKAFGVQVKALNEQDRTLDITISTVTKDRDGDMIEPGGIDVTHYMKNPVMLWAHDYSLMPIGKMLSYSVQSKSIDGRFQFAKTPLADQAFELYKGGFLNAVSIGFLVKRGGVEKMEDDDGNFIGYHIMALDLLEVSAVPVPANPEALRKSVEEGGLVLKGLRVEDSKLEIESKQKYLYTPGGDVYAIDNVEGHEHHTKTEHLRVRDAAFTKSLMERVAMGKVATKITTDTSLTGVVFEIMQQKDGEVIEGKILETIVGTKAEEPAPTPPPEPKAAEGTEGEGEGEGRAEPKAKAAGTLDRVRARQVLLAARRKRLNSQQEN